MHGYNPVGESVSEGDSCDRGITALLASLIGLTDKMRPIFKWIDRRYHRHRYREHDHEQQHERLSSPLNARFMEFCRHQAD